MDSYLPTPYCKPDVLSKALWLPSRLDGVQQGIETVNRFSDALNNQAQQIAELIDLQTKRVEKLEALSFDALRDASRHTINTIPHHKL